LARGYFHFSGSKSKSSILGREHFGSTASLGSGSQLDGSDTRPLYLQQSRLCRVSSYKCSGASVFSWKPEVGEMKKPKRKSATLSPEQKFRAVINYTTGKGLSRQGIRKILEYELFESVEIPNITAERLVGIIAGFLFVLGQDAGNSHALAEEFVAAKIPRPLGQIEQYGATFSKKKVSGNKTFT
jgi:hypothetical protein